METQNNNIKDFNELDDLRQQINELKNKVDQEGHLNEDMVKKAIQRKMKGVHRTLLWLSILAVAVIPLYIQMKYEDGFSWAFTIFTILYLIGFVITDYFINRIDISHMGDDMMETARKLTQMKKNRSRSQRIGIATSFAWLAWFCYEFYVTHQEILGKLGNRTTLFAIFFIFGVGALVGLTSSYLLYRRMQRTNDEMIDQINTFMGEK